MGDFGYENVLSIDSEEDGDGDNAGNDDNGNHNNDADDDIADDDIAADEDAGNVPIDPKKNNNNNNNDPQDASGLKPGDKPPYVPEDDDGTQNGNAMGSSGQSPKTKKKGGKGPLLFFGLVLMGGVTVYVISSDGRYSNILNRVGIGGGGYHQVTQQQSLSGEDGALEVELSLAKFYRRLAGGENNAGLS